MTTIPGPRPFKPGDVVVANGSKTMMKIERRSHAIVSSICWECSWFGTDMREKRRVFVEAALRHAKPETTGSVA